MPHAPPVQQESSITSPTLMSMAASEIKTALAHGHAVRQSSFFPPLQALLLWQSLSLFWFCGLLLPQIPLQVFCFLLFLFFMDARLRQKSNAFMAICLLLLGALALTQTLPKRPAPAAWTMQEGVPVSVLLEGEVVRVRSLPQGRVQVILQHLKPMEPHLEQHKALEGLAVWTWQWSSKFIQEKESRGLSFPLPGQKVRITAKVRTTESYRNRWGSDFGFYWQSQGVFWRLWTRDTMGNPQILGKAQYWAQLRQDVMHEFEKTMNRVREKQGKGEGAQNKSIEQQALAFLPALLLGERFVLTHTTMEDMQALSLVHSLALSGQHLAFAALLAWALLQVLSHCAPQIFLRISRQKIFVICALPLALLYLWLGNASPSLLRAFIMLVMFSVVLWRYTVVNLATILWATVCLITLFAPLILYHVGLQLSVLCVGSICLVGPLLRRVKSIIPLHRKQSFWQRMWAQIKRFFLQIFVISLAIQVALLPIMLLYFEPSGLWFVTNLIWLPLVGFWVLPWGALGLLFSCIEQWNMAVFMVQLAALACKTLLLLAERMHNFGLLDFTAVLRPHWSSVLAWISLMLGLALLPGRISWQRARQGRANIPNKIQSLFFLAAFLFCIGPVVRYVQYRKFEVRLEMFDVGHGQALAITIPGGARVLVDGAGSTSFSFDPGTRLVLPSLVYNNAPRMWAMISTHPDVDHARGLVHMLAHMSPKYFYTNGKDFGTHEQKLWKNIEQRKPLPAQSSLFTGQSIALPMHNFDMLPPLTLEVLSPPAKGSFTGNDASLILRLVQGEGAQRVGLALLCGDAEASALQALLASGRDISAKVLVLPHHGALDGHMPQLYDAVGPSIALASTGRQNAYGHPHVLVRKTLKEKNIPLYTTAEGGAIEIIFDKDVHMQKMFRNTSLGYLPFLKNYYNMFYHNGSIRGWSWTGTLWACTRVKTHWAKKSIILRGP